MTGGDPRTDANDPSNGRVHAGAERARHGRRAAVLRRVQPALRLRGRFVPQNSPTSTAGSAAGRSRRCSRGSRFRSSASGTSPSSSSDALDTGFSITSYRWSVGGLRAPEQSSDDSEGGVSSALRADRAARQGRRQRCGPSAIAHHGRTVALKALGEDADERRCWRRPRAVAVGPELRVPRPPGSTPAEELAVVPRP